MKARYSEKYYRDNWDRFMNSSRMNFEKDLEHYMSGVSEGLAELPEEVAEQALSVIRKEYARKIIANAKDRLLEEQKMICRIERGESSLGYISKTQEIQEMAKLVMMFEFNCLQLRDFTKKYEA